MSFRYLLSFLLPVPMNSTYTVTDAEAHSREAGGNPSLNYDKITTHNERATWWQWRHHIFRHRRYLIP